MDRKKYHRLRLIISLFVFLIVILSVARDSYLLSFFGVTTGLVFLVLAREKAAQLTYAIFAPTLGIGAFLLLIPYQSLSPVFAKGEFAYLESLGIILAYLALFLITIYAVSYRFLNRKYGGGDAQ
jgi:hypothetical protein